MMGLLLTEKNQTQPTEWRASLFEAGLDASQKRFAQPFENHLLGQDTFQPISPFKRLSQESAVSFKGGQERSITQVTGSEPSVVCAEHHGMHRFLSALRRKLTLRLLIWRQCSLILSAGIGHLYHV